MISIRPAISRNIIGLQRRTPNTTAAFLQANVPFPSTSSYSDETESNHDTTVRHLSSPAYRRYKAKYTYQGDTRASKPSIGPVRPGIQVPSIEVAKDMGKSFSEMENEPLMIIAEMGNGEARTEVLKRHIMAVDDVDYDSANKKMEEIKAANQQNLFWYVLPYRVGIASAFVLGIGSIPMVFDIHIAKAFNESFVTMEVPPPSDLDTILETGAWTWNWMEPVTGTLSFTLLSMQYARQQLQNLGIKPVTDQIQKKRTRALAKAFPKYNDRLLASFVASDPMSTTRFLH